MSVIRDDLREVELESGIHAFPAELFLAACVAAIACGRVAVIAGLTGVQYTVSADAGEGRARSEAHQRSET